MSKFKAGDRVRVILDPNGSKYGVGTHITDNLGKEFEVKSVERHDFGGSPYVRTTAGPAFYFRNLEPVSKTEVITNHKDLKVGDKVRITTEATVTHIGSSYAELDGEFFTDELLKNGGTIERIIPAGPTLAEQFAALPLSQLFHADTGTGNVFIKIADTKYINVASSNIHDIQDMINRDWAKNLIKGEAK